MPVNDGNETRVFARVAKIDSRTIVIERRFTIITIKEQLYRELNRLKRINQKVKQELKTAPEGTLRLGKSQGCIQYFHCTKAEGKKYISKGDMYLVTQLAQKSYNKKLLQYTDKAINQIEGLLRFYDDNKIEEIYLSEHVERQKLITPAEPTYEERLNEWLARTYVGKGFAEGAPLITSNTGLRVRSKSEKIGSSGVMVG